MIHHNLYFNLSATCFANLNTMQFDKYKERSSSLRRGATSFSDGVFLTFKLTQPSIGIRVCFLPLIGQRKAGGSFPTVCSRNISFSSLCIALFLPIFVCMFQDFVVRIIKIAILQICSPKFLRCFVIQPRKCQIRWETLPALAFVCFLPSSSSS